MKLTQPQIDLLKKGAASPDGSFLTATNYGRGGNGVSGKALESRGLAVFIKSCGWGCKVYKITPAGKEALKGAQ